MFKDFKPVLYMLLRFVAIYLVLFLAYQWYLNKTQMYGLDVYSRWIVTQVTSIQNAIGYTTQTYHEKKTFTEWFYVNGGYRTRMVEGCNAVSVMILFVAFVLAFYKGWRTFGFVLVGLFLLHIMNLLRIVGLNIIVTDLPTYSKMSHDYFFPAIIYGTVVVLWFVWLKIFVLKK